MGYSNFFFFKQIYYILKRSKRFRVFCITLIILFLFVKVCFCAVPSSVYDVEQEIVKDQIFNQNDFVFHCMFPYLGNTLYWQEELKPIFDDLTYNYYDYFIGKTKDSNGIHYYVRFYYYNDGTSSVASYNPPLLSSSYSVDIKYLTVPCTGYNVNFYPSTNSGNATPMSNNAFSRPEAMLMVKSDVMLDFMNVIYNHGTYTNLLDSIDDYLSSINTANADILSSLASLSSSLSSIQSNTSTNYSQQISAISGKIDNILNDNQEIISQNDEMIQLQEDINNNLEQVSSDIQDVKDTLTDDTVESTASDLPSTNVQDPSETGIANIFQSIYNAFCNGNAQDIVFPIPFTNKNITLSPYYVSDMLNNNGAGWVYTLIQAFWGYLIGRFIVSDISKKIDKVKSGNIENIENSNIKEEML